MLQCIPRAVAAYVSKLRKCNSSVQQTTISAANYAFLQHVINQISQSTRTKHGRTVGLPLCFQFRGPIYRCRILNCVANSPSIHNADAPCRLQWHRSTHGKTATCKPVSHTDCVPLVGYVRLNTMLACACRSMSVPSRGIRYQRLLVNSAAAVDQVSLF